MHINFKEKDMHMKTSTREMKMRQKIKELGYLLKEKEKELQRQKKILEEERISIEILKKIPAHLHSTTRMKYEAISNNSSIFEVKKMCQVLGVKAQNYYRWKSRTKKRQFHTSKVNQVWVGDITYIKTVTGWVYLAVVIDLFNREVIGYAISKKSDTELTKQALFQYIELFYNRKRMHSLLGYVSPVSYRGNFGF